MAERKVQKRTIESKKKIDTAAWKLFCEKGYFNTNTKEIAKLAGISVGNFYNYYKDKMAVYYELTRQYHNGSADGVIQLGKALEESKDKDSAIREYIRSQMERSVNTGRFFSECQLLAQDNRKLGELYIKNTDKVIDNIELVLKKVQGVKKRASYKVMARILFTMVDKMSEDACLPSNKDVFDEYMQQIEEVVQSYLFGEK